MVELDHSRLGSGVASLLTMRGTLVPPLCWDGDPWEAARTQLGRMDDKELFSPQRLRDQGTAAAVRSLLYLWNGCLKEAESSVGGVPRKAQAYILGISLRHRRRFDDAKRCFRQLGGHTIHGRLARAASEVLRDANNPSLTSFAGTLTFTRTWDPLAFADLFQQAVAGQLDRPSGLLVRKIQVEEFNLLFAASYRKATGEDPTRQSEVPDSPARRRREKQASTRDSVAPRRKGESTVPVGDKSPNPPKDNKVRLACPKCRHVNIVEATQRGKTTKCAKCGVTLSVPGGDGRTTATAGIKLACPKCRTAGVYDASLRGKKVDCKRCGAAMMIPRARPAA